jgi:hypothetical protein
MKKILIASLILSAGLVAGCKTTGTSTSSTAAPSGAVAGIDTSALVAAFKNADTETVRVVQETVSAVGKKEWSTAATHLQKLRQIPGLTASQADAVKNLLAAVSNR